MFVKKHSLSISCQVYNLIGSNRSYTKDDLHKISILNQLVTIKRKIFKFSQI